MNWFTRIVGRSLNTPRAVFWVLVVVLVVNGFLLYHRHPASPTASAPVPTSSPGFSEVTSSKDESDAVEAFAPPSPIPEATTPSISTPLSTPDSSVATLPEKASDTAEDSAPASTTTSPATDGTTPAGSPVPANLGEAISGCKGDRKACLREFVTETSPEAKYVGGRTELGANGSGRNEDILYFEDPALGTCEPKRQEYEGDGGRAYVVILVGRGSFASGEGSDCIPKA
jgi:hypothetical protein